MLKYILSIFCLFCLSACTTPLLVRANENDPEGLNSHPNDSVAVLQLPSWGWNLIILFLLAMIFLPRIKTWWDERNAKKTAKSETLLTEKEVDH